MERLLLQTLFALLASFTLLCADPLQTETTSQGTVAEAVPFSIEFAPVRDAGNIADSITHLGAVTAPYQIGKYEVTVAQWCAFLNAVATKEDPHGLYNEEMANDPLIACIHPTTMDGVTVYTPLPNTDQFPITYVSYNNALRFCNWVQNGQPTSAQDYNTIAASTENGAYTFTQLDNGTEQAALSTNAIYTLATEDQWMKAAYYAGSSTNSGYWLYPTQHNNAPNIGAVDVHNEANWDTTSYASYWTELKSEKDRVLTPVNLYTQTMGAYQTCDMGGNVNEWIMRNNEADPLSPVPITRGGSWVSKYFSSSHLALTTNDLMRTAPAQSYDSSAAALGNNTTGFRIVTSLVPPEAPPEAAPTIKSLRDQLASLQNTAPANSSDNIEKYKQIAMLVLRSALMLIGSALMLIGFAAILLSLLIDCSLVDGAIFAFVQIFPSLSVSSSLNIIAVITQLIFLLIHHCYQNL